MSKKQLEPLYSYVENELCEYMNNGTALKADDIIEAMEDRLWFAPDKYCVYIVRGSEALRKYGCNHIELTLCHKKSARRVSGGCDIAVKYINADLQCVITSIKVKGNIYTVGSK